MSEPFRIDSNLPLPKRRGRVPDSEATPWPFWQMNPGDSFFIAATDRRSRSVVAAASNFKRINPRTNFVSDWRDNDELDRKPGIRVWRTK